MFEYHCWAEVRTHGLDEQAVVVRELEERIDALDEASRESFLVNRLNGVRVMASGLRNHDESQVLEVFYWLAGRCPGCYGLMYVHREHAAEGEPQFRVHKIENGRVEILEDRYFADMR